MAIVFSLVMLAAMVFAIVDIIVRDDSQVKHMPKVLWLLLVIFVPLVGVILWFVLGRDYADGAPRLPRMSRPQRSARPAASGPAPLPSPPRDTRTTEQQLADLEREIEQERIRAEQRRRQQGDQSAS